MTSDEPRSPAHPEPWPGGICPQSVLELLADDDDPEVAAEARAELAARAALGTGTTASVTPG